MKLSNILLAIPVTKFTHLQTFQYEIMNDIHNKNECGVGWSIKKTNESEIHFERWKTIYLDFVGYSRFVCEKKMKKEDEKKIRP